MRRSLLCLSCAALLLSACDGNLTDQGLQVRVSKERAEAEPAGNRTTLAARPAPVPAPPAEDTAVPAAPSASNAAPAATTPMRTGGTLPATALPNPPFVVTEIARFDQPWAMTFLPDGRLLVTEKPGRLKLFNPATQQTGTIVGVPPVVFGGQGGLGDVILHPQFASNGLIYLSYAEAGPNSTRGAAVARAKLTLDAGVGGNLSGVDVIWQQLPKVSGENHYSHRLAFDGSGKLWVSSGDRQKLDPAQSLQSHLGKIVRLNDDGTAPADNPFVAQGGVAADVWSLGHRNVLGLAFDGQGRLWSHEMGPAGGDELNLVERGSNYGWPVVSNGDHYDGTPIPDHNTRPEFNAPEAWWTPVIAPAGFVIYSGDLFWYFRGHGFIGGLASQALIRIQFDGNQAREVARYPMGRRIREVEQGPDGALWVLEDGSDARLLRLTPVAF